MWAGGQGTAYHSSSYRNGRLAASSAGLGLLLLKLQSRGQVDGCLLEALISEGRAPGDHLSRRRTVLLGLFRRCTGF